MKYFLIYLFLETLISVEISSAIGGLNTFFEIVLSAFLGVYLLVNFKFTFAENLRAFVSREMDLEEFKNSNITSILGAILLIVPGFFTDILGILMQFGVFTTMIINRFGVKSKGFKNSFKEENRYRKEDDVIDVEIIKHNTTIKH